MKLIIVESPTKSRTLKKFLGKDYKIAATMGHIRDLPQKRFGIDVENNFKPHYIIVPGRKKTIKKLQKLKKESQSIYLGMDPDREGEAIAWHLSKALDIKNPKRIVFHEITKSAIQKGLQKPGEIDLQLVNAQQARRILDRIVGYKLSPFLWKKVVRGLSAGRVQSVAVRLVVEREREREGFEPQEYWTIKALLVKKEEKESNFEAVLKKRDGKVIPRLGIKTHKEAVSIAEELKEGEYRISKIRKREREKSPYPPFKTSTLQQEAGKKLRFSAKFTMSLAQNLYERGFITYHRSDSFNLSQQSISQAKDFIIGNYGKNYWAGFFRKYKTKSKTAQEAHEAIRPTSPGKTPNEVKKRLKKPLFLLYRLIWQRFIASQMASAVYDSLKAEVKAQPKEEKEFNSGTKNYLFQARGQYLKFEGFLKAYPIRFKEKKLPPLKKGGALELQKITPSQHFTRPPSRYTEARLIKALEKNGIGRPSTYAPIISTVQDRNYIRKDRERRFHPTEIGKVVNDILVEHFPKIVNIKFTAKMEENLDEIAEGKKEWTAVIKEFYGPFKERLQEKEKEVPDKKETYQKTEKKCPKCKAPLVIKLGKYGKFYACSNFPKCKYTESLKKNTLGIKCPQCKKGDIVPKRTKKGKVFYGCSRWPECDFALWDKPINKTCPKCNSLLTETKRNQIKCSKKECGYIEKRKNSDKMR